MEKEEKFARISLAKSEGMTPAKFKKIFEVYDSAIKYCSIFRVRQVDIDDRFMSSVWVFGEESYPESLAQIADAPPILYKLGSLSSIPSKTVAIVGTRNPTIYGERAAHKITRDYIASGYCIVSGLANGIDTIVHETCIEYKTPTIAVLGTDVNTPYPEQNADLYQRIQENGLILSENEVYEGYNKWLFPRRNRIIAGLASTTVVVEAPLKSGAMITANYAFQFDRRLISVPGSIFSLQSGGTNQIIYQNKAEIYFESIEGNLRTFGDLNQKSKGRIINQVLCLIDSGIDTLSKLIRQTQQPPSIMKDLIRDLELEKIIAKDLYGRYIVISKKL